MVSNEPLNDKLPAITGVVVVGYIWARLWHICEFMEGLLLLEGDEKARQIDVYKYYICRYEYNRSRHDESQFCTAELPSLSLCVAAAVSLLRKY